MAKGKVLIVDDEKHILSVLESFLKQKGYQVFTAQKFRKIEEFKEIDIVLLDVRLPDANGIDSIEEVKERFPLSEIIIMTAYEKDAKAAVRALKSGAFDYLVKPFKLEDLEIAIEKALEKVSLKRENEQLRATLEGIKSGFHGIVGQSDQMQTVYKQILKVAETGVPVLIEGESGTGKELCAQVIHKLSKREGKFVAINCAAIPENLLESELFGYKRGAFSGAISSKKGLLEGANGGTVFLDEIGDMPLELQSKMLRFLENFELRMLGDTSVKRVDVRIISATNRDLKELVREGRFRQDLFYRLSGFVIELPPLRNRKEDIPLLIKHILSTIEPEKEYRISSGALKALLLYDFPGNVRELKNILTQAAIMSNGTITYEDLPEYMKSDKLSMGQEKGTLDERVENFEKTMILNALKETGGNRTKAAKLLGISFRSLRYKIKKYNLNTNHP